MEWLQVSVEVEAETAEAVADVLSRFAPNGVAIEILAEGQTTPAGRVAVKAFLAGGPDTPGAQRQIEEALWHLGQIAPIPAPTFSAVAETDWADAWKEHFHPLRVGRRIVIKPTWREFESDPCDIVIELDPGMAFGTGLHPTTQMCLLALERHVRPGMTVLDMGTGSGILAVAAARLGARCVLALDNDPIAVQAAQENVGRNGVAGVVTVVEGSLDQVAGVFDLVVVNILARVILELVEKGLADHVKMGGAWVAAGIIDSQAAEIEAALRAAGLRVTEHQQVTDWVALIGKRV